MGPEAASGLLDPRFATDMPIGAISNCAPGTGPPALVPSLYALRADGGRAPSSARPKRGRC